MNRIFLDISYKGSNYAGWQVQPNANTVQAELNKALSTFFRRDVQSLGAGRTDSGVHAKQLFVHVDLEEEIPGNLYHSLNGLLPKDIAINGIYLPKENELHARFDAIARAYTYQMVFKKNPHHWEDALWVRHSIDLEAMQKAADILKTYDEFGSFCKAHADNMTNFCRMDHAYFEEQGELVLFHIRANRFLRGMVRAIVGTLLLVGNGSMSLESFRELIEAQDRKKAGPNAAAKGLFLVEVAYPEGALTKIQS
ncbi:MAG: tRNA pseudouridine(38-40) synthase TruA [Bacteroidia bacterium]|nr:tRNA pseudouridine(38-40) synthase TruA [Bacteroidia bacterium]